MADVIQPTLAAAPVATPNTQVSDQVEEVESEGIEETPPVTPAQKAQEKKYLKKLKFKLDNEEFDEDLPFELPDDPKAVEYMKRQIQLSKMAQKRAGQYSSLEKEVASFLTLLKEDPETALSNPAIGVDVKQLAAKIIEKEIENAKKSPEQIDKENLQKELKKLQDERKREQDEFQERELTRLQEREFERYDQSITRALESTTLPKSPYVVKKIADYMMTALENGIDASPEDIMPLVKEEVENDIKQMFGAMPDEVVEAFLGKERIKNIRRKYVQKAKQAPTPINKQFQDVAKSQPEPKQPVKRTTIKDFFKI